MRALFVALPVLALVACTPSDECQPSDTRCSGNLVEVCGADRTWYFRENCDTYAGPNTGEFTCQSYARESGDAGDLGHACLRAPTGGDAL